MEKVTSDKKLFLGAQVITLAPLAAFWFATVAGINFILSLFQNIFVGLFFLVVLPLLALFLIFKFLNTDQDSAFTVFLSKVLIVGVVFSVALILILLLSRNFSFIF